MDQMDALLLVGESLLGILAFMALIGLALVLVNLIGRRRGQKPGIPEPKDAADSGETMEHSITKDKGE